MYALRGGPGTVQRVDRPARRVVGAALITAHAHTASPTLIARAGCAATARSLAWKLIAWQRAYLVVTSHRVMLITGIVKRRIAMMPLAKIADVKVEQPLPGRVAGYGTSIRSRHMNNSGRDGPGPLSQVLTCPYANCRSRE